MNRSPTTLTRTFRCGLYALGISFGLYFTCFLLYIDNVDQWVKQVVSFLAVVVVFAFTLVMAVWILLGFCSSKRHYFKKAAGKLSALRPSVWNSSRSSAKDVEMLEVDATTSGE